MKNRILCLQAFNLLTVLIAFGIALHTELLVPGARISRKAILKVAGLGLTVLATGGWRSRSSLTASEGSQGVLAAGCVLTPKQTEGPYYIPKEKLRSNIAEHQPGTPLKLRFNIVDAATCKPIKDAAVDIWHCNAGGVYSGFISASTGGPGGGGGPTDKHTFLRGIQRSNSSGHVQFETVYPGWYRGRTVHIHVKVHLKGAVVGHVVHTGQLYFADSLTSRVYRSRPYRARASQRDTFNNTDSIYGSGGRQSTLNVKRDGHGGYTGTITLGVHHS